uniref:Uncharacterized protein n=1 Tax=Arundo donax TaxID=35708 RepID=A0A0A9EGY1_ARUDO
MRATEKRSN